MVSFYVKDCTLAVISTGESASSLTELRDLISRVSGNSLYYHFWGGRMRPSFLHSEYLNDFAYLAHFSLHDDILAERLEIIVPNDYEAMEELRLVLLEIIEQRIDETDHVFWLKKEAKFYFLSSTIIVFDTPIVLAHPAELKTVLPTLSSNAIYYHFIDARRRTRHNIDDFSSWLDSYEGEYTELIQKIQHIDPYFFPLTEIKQSLSQLFNELIP